MDKNDRIIFSNNVYITQILKRGWNFLNAIFVNNT